MDKLDKKTKDVSGGIIREVSIEEKEAFCPNCGNLFPILSKVNVEGLVKCPRCGRAFDPYEEPTITQDKYY